MAENFYPETHMRCARSIHLSLLYELSHINELEPTKNNIILDKYLNVDGNFAG